MTNSTTDGSKSIDLEAVRAEHSQWLRDNTTGKQADLRGADLREADLREAELRGADLTGAILCDADMDGAMIIHRGRTVIIRFEYKEEYDEDEDDRDDDGR